MNDFKLAKSVRIWLYIGLVMIFFQVVIGGITRLTESGLSITKWEVVTGTLPPLSGEGWHEEFELYKETPQYQKLNQGMSLSQFKWIYFWEYLHRLWARTMGFVFLFPFLIYLKQRKLSSYLVQRLMRTVALAGIVGVFGWIMVASGLVNRPWVNAYKLTIHLGLALILYSYHLNTILKVSVTVPNQALRAQRGVFAFLLVLVLQIFLGGLMSGMKAALVYPTFPDFHGQLFPEVLFQASSWSVDNIVNYDKSAFMPALVQLLHRSTAYILIISMLLTVFRNKKELNRAPYRMISTLWIILLIMQAALGIFVLLGSIGSIPVTSGVLHQAFAILLLTATLVMWHFTKGT